MKQPKTKYFDVKCGLVIDDRDIFESCYVELFGGVTSVLKHIRDGDEYKCKEPEILNSCWAMWKKARS